MNTVLVVLFVLVILSFITGVCLTIYEKMRVVSKNPKTNIVINDDIEVLEIDDFGIDFCDAEII